MNQHRCILERYKGNATRYSCPQCNHRRKTFTRYIYTETNEHIHPTVGKCERANNCGYHYTPKQYFKDNNISFDKPSQRQPFKKWPIAPVPKPVSVIPVELFKHSLMNYERNNFVKFLIGLFGNEIAEKLISQYFIGTSKHWNGATVFYQIDNEGKIRTGKIILYNPVTGKRNKETKPPVQWVHKALKLPDYELKQCLFGEHILSIEPLKPVAIVESEKTAIIASIYLPQYIWLASGAKEGLNNEKCKVLSGRNVTLFPDLNCFEKWNSKAKELSSITRFQVSSLLEDRATEADKIQGLDIADYLVKFKLDKFINISKPN